MARVERIRRNPGCQASGAGRRKYCAIRATERVASCNLKLLAIVRKRVDRRQPAEEHTFQTERCGGPALHVAPRRFIYGALGGAAGRGSADLRTWKFAANGAHVADLPARRGDISIVQSRWP